ncbi:putative beta-galactosidase A [Hypsizygus marmoreus]|uniref:beta-galactosidase n=1 Tax=Hypsizygus marmoreus TaxID=39966 RepID=A0A369J8V5_HYPMA|nr:putative beta-galactosidase A [Hypsizygus marmoreus]
MKGILRMIFALSLAPILRALTKSHPLLLRRQSTKDESDKYVLPVGSPNFYHGQSNAAVTFDQHSLLLDGKRVMFFSGEFHPFRLPAPELWRDVLEKFKAAGFNGVSVYWHWGLSSPNSKEIRFTEHNDLAKFYQVAKEVGILVIIRPGPYVNAETAGGGIPGWVTNIKGLARTNATDYREAWHPYILQFAKETAPFQYPNGPVIAVQSENEYSTRAQSHIPGLDEHMQDIIDTFREGGIIKVPIIHNDKNPSGQYSQAGLGKVDLYGWDGYPLGFDCDNPARWLELSTQFDTSHQRWNPAEPLALFEWQGGAFSYWSGPGYSECYKLINEQFANVYYKNNYASGVGLQNLYMTYGGTNWGNMHTHTIYSSYDYGAAIREDRTLTPKLDEIKLQSYFLHASPDYLLVGRIGNGTVGQGTAYSTSPDIYTTHLNSPSSGANFYIVRQVTNTKLTNTDFTLRVNTTLAGEITIPKADNSTLAGRESKIIVSNYPFGSSKLQYSTAEIMTWVTMDVIDVLVAYALSGQYIEVAVENPTGSIVSILGSRSIKASLGPKVVTLSGSASGITVVNIGSKRIIIADKKAASGFWAPRLAVSGMGHDHYDLGPDVPSILVHGPYFVRSAAARSGTLLLTGDLNSTTVIDVFAPSKFISVTWNGVPVKVARSELGSLRGSISFPTVLNSVQVPVLEKLQWSCADSLPELDSTFDDSTWVLANKTETSRPQKPTGGKNVLYSSEYGFHAGQWVWRGHFTGSATGVQLSIQGGFSFGYSAFLNSHFLGSGQGSSHSQEGVDILSPVFNFTADQLLPGDNVITVIHDSTGMNQDYDIDDEFKTPRGIRGYKLLSDDGKGFAQWRVAGNIGGENAPDKVRGPYNEGGWWFERVGAHLPGYDASGSSWKKGCTPYQGISKAGVTVYRTTFNLDFPKSADIPLAFDFALDSVAPHRVLIYVNGWQFGRFLSSLGPQTSFPVPEGILDHHGKNEVLISLWALGTQGAKLSKLELNKRATIASSKTATINVVKAPGWKELRGNVVTN